MGGHQFLHTIWMDGTNKIHANGMIAFPKTIAIISLYTHKKVYKVGLANWYYTGK